MFVYRLGRFKGTFGLLQQMGKAPAEQSGASLVEERMRSLPKALLAIGVVGLLTCAGAYGLMIEIGKTVVSATADISPRALPAKGGAPVDISSITRIKTTDGSAPGTLKQLVFVFDKHG